MNQVRKTTNERLAGIVLVAFSLAILFIAFAATQQSRCRIGNKVCGCDSPVVDGVRRLDTASTFRGIPGVLSAQLAFGDPLPETSSVPTSELSIPRYGASASVAVLALAPKTSPPRLCA